MFFSRQTGALNRIIDRGSNAINFILTVTVFNIVPTILEVLIITSPTVTIHQLCILPVILMLLLVIGATYSRSVCLSFVCIVFCFVFTDWYGVKYTCLQVRLHFCLDYFSFSCYLYCFHFGFNTGANAVLCHHSCSLMIFLVT